MKMNLKSASMLGYAGSGRAHWCAALDARYICATSAP
jgi:hypothetical protein